ncbi:nitrile hydratase subunit alpha, partial [Limnospira indica]
MLIEKGIIGSETVNKVLEYFDSKMGPFNGAKLVAKAWVDPDFKE